MANNKSVVKKIRQNKIRKLRNRYMYKSTRTEIKKLKIESNINKDKEKVILSMSRIFSMIDKLKKKNIIHKNKASRLKSKLAKKYNKVYK